MTSKPSSHPGARQRGAALLMAMVIVTVVATLSASMVWQQWRAVQVESADRARSQSQWVLIGALDWARAILYEDAASPPPSGRIVDHLGEPWAQALAEARLSSFLATDKENTDDGPEAFLSGKIEDLNGRYNLRNLLEDVNNRYEINQVQLAAFKQLLVNIGIRNSVLYQLLADNVRQAALVTQNTPEALVGLGSAEARGRAPVMPQTVDQLVWLGATAAEVETMRPYVTILPPNAPINLNTASKEVLAAVIPGLDLGGAERLVRQRQSKPFEEVSDAQQLLGAAIQIPTSGVGVTSNYFEVKGRLRMEDRVIEQRHIVERLPQGRNTLVVVHYQDRFSTIDPGR